MEGLYVCMYVLCLHIFSIRDWYMMIAIPNWQNERGHFAESSKIAMGSTAGARGSMVEHRGSIVEQRGSKKQHYSVA